MRPPGTTQRRLSLIEGGKRAEEPATRFQHDDWANLARSAGSGDSRAVRTFLVNVGPHILRVVRRLLGSQHPEIEDVAQECAFAVIDALPAFRGESSAVHFTCRIALLTAMNTRRRSRATKRAHEADGEAALDNVACLRPGPEQRVSSRAAAEIVRELLRTLPMEQAEVLALHCVLGYTLGEMAASSGVPRETLKSRLRLAKEAFRRRALTDPRALELFALWEEDSV